MPTLSREEVEKKFPLAIRGVGNLILGKRYKKVYSHLNNYSEKGELIKVWLATSNIGIKWQYQLKTDNGQIYEGFCADAGVVSYAENKWNSTNYLMEII